MTSTVPVAVPDATLPEAGGGGCAAGHSAIVRGVRLVVMWGRTSDDKLPSEVLNAFNELQRNPNAIVLLPERSSRTQACLVIQDNVRALVGSRSPLDGSAADVV